MLLLAAVWALLASTLAQSVEMTSWDDNCYAAHPVWAVGQAVIAFAGVGFTARGAFMLLRHLGPHAGWRRPLGTAAVVLVAWLIAGLALNPLDSVLCPGQPPQSF